jgi:plasmid stabilization system protein ParE
VVARRFRVTWTNLAQIDLDEAVSHIATQSQSSALSQLERLLSAAASLSELPDRGRTVPELADPNFRELILPPYRLIYLRGESQVWVVALIHTSQEFRRRMSDLQP